MSSVSNPGDYLGMPAIWGRSKRQSLAYVNGRVLGKIQGWKQSAVSLAGNEVLIKAVIQAIPTYPMNLFKFPAAVYKDLDSLSAGFWWGDTGGKKRIHWSTRSWDIDFLRSFISEAEVKAICDIPLGYFSCRDWLVWFGARCGKYSVRAGYHWIHSSRLMVGASNSLDLPNFEDMIWKAMWKVEPIWFGGQLSLRRMGDGVSSFNSWIREMINLASHPQ
ncbi:hypothetical protein PS2_001104 [Malus domestica]